MVVLGPRAGILIWWLLDQTRWERAFDSFFWAFLGFIFLPWTTLMYVAVGLGGLRGFDWVWMAIAVMFDLGAYSGGAYSNRERGMEYANRYR